MNKIILQLKRILVLLTRNSQILNEQSTKGIYSFIYFCLGVFFFLRVIQSLIITNYTLAILTSIRLLLACLLKYFSNDAQKSRWLTMIFFWIASFIYIYLAFIKKDVTINENVKNIWIYETIIGSITPIMSLHYQIIFKIIYHALIGKISVQSYQDTFVQVIEYLIMILMVNFSIWISILKNIHYENEFDKRRDYEDFLYNNDMATFKFTKNSQNQIIILKCNRDDIKSYGNFIDFYSTKNLKYDDALPYCAISFINLIEILINDDGCEKIRKNIIAFSNKGNIKQQKFNIYIMKQQENFKTIVFLQISHIDNEEQKQFELMRTRDLIINSINHDVKNPLIAGSILTDLMITQFNNKQNINYDNLLSVKFYFKIVLTLIVGYFDFTLAQLGKLKIQTENFDFFTSTLETIQMMQYSAKKRSVHLKSHFTQKKLNVINDVTRLQQVLMNLINNSIKFSFKDQEVIIHVEEFIQHNLIYISIIDYGVGMSPQIIQQIGQTYASFNQNNMNSQGTGIGLYTSQKIVGVIGPLEKINIQSVEGQGSELSFFIYLNAENEQIKTEIERFDRDFYQILSYLRNIDNTDDTKENYNDMKINKVKVSQNTQKSFHIKSVYGLGQQESKDQLKILIVDDEEIIRTATKNAIKNLDKEKYLIFEAENGLVALDLFTKLNQSKSDSNIDLIFTDIQMPDLNGYQLVEAINELVEQQNYIYPEIIALSSNMSDEYHEKCRAINIIQKFTKPQSAEQIRDLIRKFEAKQILTKE